MQRSQKASYFLLLNTLLLKSWAISNRMMLSCQVETGIVLDLIYFDYNKPDSEW